MFFNALLNMLPWIGVMFVVMIFLASCRRILSFLTLFASIATIISIFIIRQQYDVTEYAWIPILLTLVAYMTHCGDAYMNPSIVEGVYRVVAVERKWNSIFADDDDYVVHLAPKEIGGFIEYTIIGILLFGSFYGGLIMGSSWAIFIPSFYLLGMAIVEIIISILSVLNIIDDFPSLLYWLGRFFVILITIVLAVTGSFKGDISKPVETDKNYLFYEELVNDHGLSYIATLDTGTYDNPNPVQIAYDNNYDIGVVYTEEYGEINYLYVYYKDPRVGCYAKFTNIGEGEPEFRLDARLENYTENPLKDSASMVIGEIGSLIVFDKEMYNKLKFEDYQEDGLNFKRLSYEGKTEDSKCSSQKYKLDYNFATYTDTSTNTTYPTLPYEIVYTEINGKKEFNRYYQKTLGDISFDFATSLLSFGAGKPTLSNYTPIGF